MRQLVAAGILMLCVTAAGAQTVIPKSDDFQVNTLTLGYQDGVDVGMSDNGEFVIVWLSGESAGSDTDGIQARRYMADGTPYSVEFQVNSYTTGGEIFPSVAVGPSGDFVVVWMTYQATGLPDPFSIQGQLFDSSGSPVGGQFQVNTFTTNNQNYPNVAMDPAGNFVVVWQSFFDGTGDDDDGHSVQGQRYAADGQPQGGQFQVNSFTTYAQLYPAVATDSSGNFVVVWQSYRSADTDTSGFSVVGQRFAANGALVGSEFQANSYTTGDQYLPDVAINSAGEFVVVWQDNDYFGSGYGVDGDDSGIVARRFSATGTPLGAEFIANTFTDNGQRFPAVAIDVGDRFMLVWSSDGSPGTDTSDDSVQARQYDADGTPMGVQFQVNTHTPESQYNPSVAFGSDGRFVVAWGGYSSPGDDDVGSSAQARRFLAALFTDGFESGDTSAWSQTVP